MKRNIILIIVLTLIMALWQTNIKGQTYDINEKVIYLMRAKQFYGSGAKMDLMINGELFYKIKNGNRLIIKTNTSDSIDIQIVYTPIKSHKSEVLQILPNSETEVYIDLFYWGEGYNPLKHAGVITGPTGGTPEFNIEIVEMDKNSGEQKFNDEDFFNDNKKIIEKVYP